MIQLQVMPASGCAFRGKRMKDTEILEKIKTSLQKDALPEFGTFPPITLFQDFEDKSRLTFTLQSVEGSNKAKKATFAYLNFSNGKLAVKSKKFESKAEAEAYLNSLKDEDILNIISEFKQKTK